MQMIKLTDYKSRTSSVLSEIILTFIMFVDVVGQETANEEVIVVQTAGPCLCTVTLFMHCGTMWEGLSA